MLKLERLRGLPDVAACRLDAGGGGGSFLGVDTSSGGIDNPSSSVTFFIMDKSSSGATFVKSSSDVSFFAIGTSPSDTAVSSRPGASLSGTAGGGGGGGGVVSEEILRPSGAGGNGLFKSLVDL